MQNKSFFIYSIVRNKVLDKTGISLELEIKIIGEKI